MAISIFNTLSGKKEIFKPIRRGRVGIYVCGPTVYDNPHIGHLRSAYIFEIIRKYFIYRGYKVKFIKNITDIDDKIIDKANDYIKKSSGEKIYCVPNLKEKVKEISGIYAAKYHRAMEAFGISSPDIEPKATEHIGPMVKIVKILLKKGFAYQVNSDIYFSVKKFAGYGKLSHQSAEQLKTGVRIEPNDKKNDPLDFTLWKTAKENEPYWRTPWGQGRPGWHIECSAMSTKYLGRTFDIHGGGKDLAFPHHENEIAQSESFTGRTLANYWIHNGLLTVNGEKMSKSLGNFISVNDILDEYNPEALKLFFLSAHYSSPIDFSYERIEEAKRARERFYILLDKIDNLSSSLKPQASSKKRRKGLSPMVKKFRQEFFEAMDDDFNMPRALAALYELVNLAHKNIEKRDMVVDIYRLLLELGAIFGLFTQTNKESAKNTLPAGFDQETISGLIEKRNELRRKKEFLEADKIRKDLEKIGILLEDSPDKTGWRIK